MVTVTCTDNTCPNGGIDYNVLGAPEFVECGGCGVHLAPYDLRDDPPVPSMFPVAPSGDSVVSVLGVEQDGE